MGHNTKVLGGFKWGLFHYENGNPCWIRLDLIEGCCKKWIYVVDNSSKYGPMVDAAAALAEMQDAE